ncbi:MAG: type II toxin-antitoxin system Phd/YefM family antitoxin [Xanthomonadales bacterium PRO6]|nr:type II toxin-antitoxin system Phd/YefM family antitoxin [Xanthomonadales bacterium PRO6]
MSARSLVITDRGKPAHVLLGIEDYRRRCTCRIRALCAMP